MKFIDIKKEAKIFRPAILLDKIISRTHRYFIRNMSGYCAVLFAGYFVFVKEDERIGGLFFITISIWALFLLLDFFYNSNYVGSAIALHRQNISFAAAALLYETLDDDITRGLLFSRLGRILRIRLGIDQASFAAFFETRKTPLRSEAFEVSDNTLTVALYAKAVLDNDKEFKDMLIKLGITESIFLGAVSWIEEAEHLRLEQFRWWTRDRLSQKSQIGKNWSYGGAFFLERFAKDIKSMSNTLGFLDVPGYERKEGKEIEAVLSRRREANALIISEKGEGGLETVFHLWKRIHNGTVPPELCLKRVMVLDTNMVVAFAKDKATFEQTLIKILNDAVKAGNIILVIEDLPSFVLSAKGLNSDIADLVEQYLASPSLQVIALSDRGRYHEFVEPIKIFGERFEIIKIKTEDDNALLAILKHEALVVENRDKIFFTYQALDTIVKDAERYFSEGVTLDKVIDLLEEIVPKAKQEGVVLITRTFVENLVEQKTGIPLGDVSETERQKLLTIEDDMRGRIVGQEIALGAIGSALKRSRGGVANTKRPIGSFLFLGPTGVGKTETTKAIADLYFGNEQSLIRFDMTEFTGQDGLAKLIGSFEGSKVGLLVKALRDRPYGVLLLDEFEKASTEVRDLFLQVVDEGFFTDSHGNRVNALNLIIVATTNAGSSLIWEIMRKGDDLLKAKDTIIDHIIKEGIFRPELLNRFDEVVLFHPLDKEQLAKIAELMLGKLKRRLEDKGVVFEGDADLVPYLVEIGSTEQFGARAMNRAIQDSVEKFIAEEILEKNLRTGATVHVSVSNLTKIPIQHTI